MTKVRKKRAPKRTKEMDGLSCPNCNSLIFQSHGKQKNGANRYLCTTCWKRFNQNTGRNVLTEREFIVNKILKSLFSLEKDYFDKAKKDKAIVNTKKFVRDASKKFKNLKASENKQLEFISIQPGSKNVKEVNNGEVNTKKYIISEHSEDFSLCLRDDHLVYLINKMPDQKCKKLILETSEYSITVEKHTDRYRQENFDKNFKDFKKSKDNCI